MCVLLQTPRFLLRPFRTEDDGPLGRIYASTAAMRYLGDGRTGGIETARRSIAMHAGDWSLVGYGPLAIEDRESGAFVGRAGLWGLAARRPGELGWIVSPERWGDGIATEATAAVIADAFTRVGLPQVVAFVDPDNGASIRVAEKVGLGDPRLDHHAYPRPHLRFSLSREVWSDRLGGPTPMGAVSIRDYSSADHDAVFGIYAAAVRAGLLPRTPPATHEMFRSGWLDGARAVRVAVAGSRLVGCHFVRPAYRDEAGSGIANAGYLVDADARGRGIGTALLLDSLDVARGLGFRAMLFMRIREGSASDLMYRRHGFTLVGRVPGGLGSTSAILLWREL